MSSRYSSEQVRSELTARAERHRTVLWLRARRAPRSVHHEEKIVHRSALKLVPMIVLLTLSCGGDDAGATVAMVLNEDGTTTGRVFAPGLDEGGQDLDVDLAGTWTLQGETVTFNQTGDTFIRDIPFAAGRNRLQGEGVYQTITVRLTLTKE